MLVPDNQLVGQEDTQVVQVHIQGIQAGQDMQRGGVSCRIPWLGSGISLWWVSRTRSIFWRDSTYHKRMMTIMGLCSHGFIRCRSNLAK